MHTAERQKVLMIDLLVAAAGGSAARWRRLIGPVTLHSRFTHPRCNWSVSPVGTMAELAAINAATNLVRAEHRHVKA